MAEIHTVRMTHKRCDLILDALQAAAEVEPDNVEVYGEIASDLLETLDRQHRLDKAAEIESPEDLRDPSS